LLVATQLLNTHGQGTVLEHAESVGLSVRQLERQFQAQVGMTPKMLSRLSRFEAAQRYIFEQPAPSFTRLAHDLGYADQAHFNREFRAFAALSPGGFLAESREFVRRQARVAFVQDDRSSVF
jgi:transcriptional regulator GlxA family with amidase domain